MQKTTCALIVRTEDDIPHEIRSVVLFSKAMEQWMGFEPYDRVTFKYFKIGTQYIGVQRQTWGAKEANIRLGFNQCLADLLIEDDIWGPVVIYRADNEVFTVQNFLDYVDHLNSSPIQD